eukprot:2943286-Pyramimonas_sp.AAC.1
MATSTDAELARGPSQKGRNASQVKNDPLGYDRCQCERGGRRPNRPPLNGAINAQGFGTQQYGTARNSSALQAAMVAL